MKARTVNASDVMSGLAVRVDVVGVMRASIRLRLSVPIFKLAAAVAGCKIAINVNTNG